MNWKISRLIIMIVAILALLLSNAGWDRNELDTLAIVTGIGIDIAEQPEMIDFSAQIGKVSAGGISKKEGKSEDEPSLLLDSTNTSVLAAIETLRYDNSRSIFLHHNQVIIFGSDQARKGISSYLDVFMRDHEGRMEVSILVADDKAKDILSTNIKLEKISAIGLTRMIKNQTEISKSLGVNMLQFTSKLIEETTAPVAPLVKIVEEDNEKRLSITEMAVFKCDSMVGKLNKDETQGYLWVMGNQKGGTVPVSTVSGSADLSISSAKCQIDPVLHENGQVSVSLKIEAKFIIGDLKGFKDMKFKQIFPLLEQAASEQIQDEVTECFNITQNLNTDIYGIGAAIHRKYPKEWKTIKDSWDNIYPEITISQDVKAKLVDTGKISDSLDMKEGE